MLTAANITVQFGKKPLFENVNAKFSDGNRYGLIGANGAGKSTLVKVFGGTVKPNAGSVSLSSGERMGTLSQDQFAFEDERVIDTVIMGHSELWDVYKERNEIYSKTDMTEADGVRVADLEMQFAELDGYSAEPRAGELLLGLDIPEASHTELMSTLAPALKLRVLLAQVLFADPQVLLLDEPTNNLDIGTIHWLEDTLNQSKATMIIISHDRHFLNSVCTHIADLDYGALKIYPGNYDEFTMASMQARQLQQADVDKKKAQVEQLQAFVRRFSANASKAKQATSRARLIEKINIDEIRPSSRRSPYIKLIQGQKLFRQALSVKKLSKSYGEHQIFKNVSFNIAAGEKVAIIGTTGIGKTTMMRCIVGDLECDNSDATIKFAEQAQIAYYAQDNSDMFANDN